MTSHSDHTLDALRFSLTTYTKRYKRVGNKVLFKSRVRMKTFLADQHYNQWYEIASIPPDIQGMKNVELAVAIVFEVNGRKPLSEDEVRSSIFAKALIQGAI